MAKKKEEPKLKKLRFLGIKNIGSLWYSSKDDYRKSFNSANACAEYFNGVEENEAKTNQEK